MSYNIFVFVLISSIHVYHGYQLKQYNRKNRLRDDNFIINQVEELVQRDEGDRGIKELINGNILYDAALDLSSCQSILIMTGFPCLIDNPECQQETDGPLGCMALARCMIVMNKNVTIVTDDTCAEAIFECAIASGIIKLAHDNNIQLKFESFKSNCPLDQWEIDYMYELRNNHDSIISIERTGPNQNGDYMTMSGRKMNHLVALFAK